MLFSIIRHNTQIFILPIIVVRSMTPGLSTAAVLFIVHVASDYLRKLLRFNILGMWPLQLET